MVPSSDNWLGAPRRIYNTSGIYVQRVYRTLLQQVNNSEQNVRPSLHCHTFSVCPLPNPTSTRPCLSPVVLWKRPNVLPAPPEIWNIIGYIDFFSATIGLFELFGDS